MWPPNNALQRTHSRVTPLNASVGRTRLGKEREATLGFAEDHGNRNRWRHHRTRDRVGRPVVRLHGSWPFRVHGWANQHPCSCVPGWRRPRRRPLAAEVVCGIRRGLGPSSSWKCRARRQSQPRWCNASVVIPNCGTPHYPGCMPDVRIRWVMAQAKVVKRNRGSRVKTRGYAAQQLVQPDGRPVHAPCVRKARARSARGLTVR